MTLGLLAVGRGEPASLQHFLGGPCSLSAPHCCVLAVGSRRGLAPACGWCGVGQEQLRWVDVSLHARTAGFLKVPCSDQGRMLENQARGLCSMQARVLGGAGGWVTAFPALSLLTRSLGAVRAEEAGFLSPGSRSFPAPSPLGGQVPGWGPGAGQAGRSLVANGSWSLCSDPLGATLAISGSWVGGVRADQTSPNLPALSLEQSLSGRRTRLPPRPSSQDPQPTRARSLQSRPQPALRTRRQGAAVPWPAPAGSPGPAPPLPVPAKPRRAGGRPWKVSAPPGPRPAPRPRPPGRSALRAVRGSGPQGGPWAQRPAAPGVARTPARGH